MTVGDQIAASATNFLTGVIIGRSCSKIDFGIYMLGYSLLLFLITVQNALIGSPLCIIRSRLKQSEIKTYMGSTLLLQAGFSTLAVSLLFALHSLLTFALGIDALGGALLPLVTAIPFVLIKEHLRKLCFASFRPGAAFALDGSLCVLQSAGFFALARMNRLDPSIAFAFIALSSGLLSLCWIVFNKSDFRFNVTATMKDLRRSWSVGSWIFSSSILWAGTIYACPWLVATIKGPANAATWAACFGIASMANPLLIGTQNYLEPKIPLSFSQGGFSSMRKTVYQGALFLGTLMLTYTLILFLTGDSLAKYVYGTAYQGHTAILCTLSLVYALGAIGFPFSCGLFATERSQLDTRINVSYPIVMVCFGVPGVYIYGPLGAATTLLLAHVLALILRVRAFNAPKPDAINSLSYVYIHS